ncbi:MAG TPA: methionyl-tRNA formyltransferase [candidate division Zixibacteria bacterium]|nr:methionyl-tRNA formyltransferase [candidate division Zixibacteria bacterium]
MKIIYMGTPAFACKPLATLQNSRHEVQAVVTGMSKRRGRRGDECPTDVCCLANDLDLPVLTPQSLKSKKLHQQLAEFNTDLFVVIAFRILPESLFRLPRYGSINIHASLLPKYRGAAPINWALINGEKETGLTSFFLNTDVDTGSIILQTKTDIDPNENYDTLYARLSDLSGQFLLDTLDRIERSDFNPTGQDNALASPAPKLTPFDGLIDFGFPAERIKDFVRGLSTRPGAYSFFRGKKVKIYRCRPVTESVDLQAAPGTVLADRKRLLIKCADTAVEIEELVPEGKKPMDGRSFLNGMRPEAGERFGEVMKGGEKVS